MHEIFSEIIRSDDVRQAVRKKVIEGIISESDEEQIREKIENLISQPVIRDWFEKGNKVLNETSVLMPGSMIKRPDRVILRNGEAINH